MGKLELLVLYMCVYVWVRMGVDQANASNWYIYLCVSQDPGGEAEPEGNARAEVQGEALACRQATRPQGGRLLGTWGWSCGPRDRQVSGLWA